MLKNKQILQQTKILEFYNERMEQLLKISDAGERFCALNDVKTEIEKKFIKTSSTKFKKTLLKYAPLTATVTGLIGLGIGSVFFPPLLAAGFLTVITGGAHLLVAAQNKDWDDLKKDLLVGGDKLSQDYEERKAYLVKDFKALQQKLENHADQIIEKTPTTELAASSHRSALMEHLPELASVFNSIAPRVQVQGNIPAAKPIPVKLQNS